MQFVDFSQFSHRAINLTGRRFGRLTTLGAVGRDKWNTITWRCQCDCGNVKDFDGQSLRDGYTKSCGCLLSESSAQRATKHGKCDLPEWTVWKGMRERCYYEKHKQFKDYGGRGINVCDRWKDNFGNFFADMGPRPSPTHSIDRFPDNNGDYEPGNCRWATAIDQGQRRRNSKIVTAFGRTASLAYFFKAGSRSKQYGRASYLINTGVGAEAAISKALALGS